MTIATVRRLAADIFSVGQNKVKISPDGLKEAEGALTRADVKGLIDKGIVIRLKPQGRASTKKFTRIGRGRRKGTPLDSKAVWMDKVRSQRKFLAMMVSTGALRKEAKREIYNKVKSGIFRSKRAMLLYLKDNKFVAADYEPPKPVFKKPEPKPSKAAKAAAPAAKPAAPGAKPVPTTAKPPQPKAVENQGERR
ncbi:hypothetical protein H0O00_04895 [Candidatus Micrarchaeota archaeon]|nr:hypothetical protein [Candidatus Micrarchaeota archaeon]